MTVIYGQTTQKNLLLLRKQTKKYETHINTLAATKSTGLQ